MVIRKKEIEVWQKVGIDKETHTILRKQKKIQNKSIMRIVKTLIFEKYGCLNTNRKFGEITDNREV